MMPPKHPHFLPHIKNPYWIIIFSFLLWVFLFRDFLSAKLALVHDAVSYYEQIKFFLDNVSLGVFPLWNPTWESGAPNDFFLRRIGAYNPFYGFILILQGMGLNYTLAYLAFLGAYYFLGIFGFYKLAHLIFRDTKSAFLAYLLLLFSSLGTNLFDSYLHLIFVPMIWFFFFLVDFSRNPQKHSFLGLIFCFMLLMTTYIPFYFATIFLSFVFCFIIIFFQDFLTICRRNLSFLNHNKIFAGFCLAALLLSALPSITFFHESSRGEFTLPFRADASSSQNALEVNINKITEWSIGEEVYFSYLLSNLPDMHFKVLYIPLFAYLIFSLGAMSRINKKLLLFFIWSLLVFLITTPQLPIYSYLYTHVFFFKYFRNSHFFLWLILLPLLILFVTELFRSILTHRPTTKKENILTMAFLLAVHFIGFLLTIFTKTASLTSFLTICFSFIFFILIFNGRLISKEISTLIFLLGLVFLPATEVYYHLSLNSPSYAGPSTYDRPFTDFSYTHSPDHTQKIYFGTKWYHLANSRLDYTIFGKYLSHKFILYDRTENISDKNLSFKEVEQAFAEQRNVAFVSSSGEDGADSRDVPKEALVIEKDAPEFRLLSYNMNSIKVKTNFPSRKFLVYNDSFDSRWQAFVNRQPVPVERANIAFKGLWIPPGENVVYFHFGTSGAYLMNYVLLALFYFLLISLLFLWITFSLRKS